MFYFEDPSYSFHKNENDSGIMVPVSVWQLDANGNIPGGCNWEAGPSCSSEMQEHEKYIKKVRFVDRDPVNVGMNRKEPTPRMENLPFLFDLKLVENLQFE